MRFLRAIEFRQAGTIRLFYEACELKEGKRKERKKWRMFSFIFDLFENRIDSPFYIINRISLGRKRVIDASTFQTFQTNVETPLAILFCLVLSDFGNSQNNGIFNTF